MASDRRLQANRLNAQKSTGPRSRAGKQRAARNAYRHGLAAASRVTTTEDIDVLARMIAGESDNPLVREHARDAAQAVSDLKAIGRIRAALVERASVLGTMERPKLFESIRDIKSFLSSIAMGETPELPARGELPAPKSTQSEECMGEAVRVAIKELANLHRYEARAAGRRNRAVKEIIRARSRAED